ncbi:hypothetical protein [Microbacterium sp.]|uniref:hypothetical protein n=1 Tax=Microbacterium sp. TaxID=51671 RepID=UPI003C729D7F
MTLTATTPRRTVRLADLRTLPPLVTLPVAGRLFGFARATSYDLHAAGEFPVHVMKIGQRFFVRTADLARSLGIDPAALLDDPAPAADETPATD